jgi:hypothetical protein
MSEKRFELEPIVTVELECGCMVQDMTVTLCQKHYANWRNSLAEAEPAKPAERNLTPEVGDWGDKWMGR